MRGADSMRSLLKVDAAARLGSGSEGEAEVQSAAFFKDVDWAKIERRAVPPPFQPSLPAGPLDIGNIDKKYTSAKAAPDSPVSPSCMLSPSKVGTMSHAPL
jgi:hypothetical protein